jgi:hypothetical protein
VDGATGRWTGDILAADCTHVSGDYWHVWPAVFHANMTLADRGEDRVVWGLTIRSNATRPLWRGVPLDETRVGWLLPPGHPEPPDDTAVFWREDFPAARKAGERRTLWVYVPTPVRVASSGK